MHQDLLHHSSGAWLRGHMSRDGEGGFKRARCVTTNYLHIHKKHGTSRLGHIGTGVRKHRKQFI